MRSVDKLAAWQVPGLLRVLASVQADATRDHVTVDSAVVRQLREAVRDTTLPADQMLVSALAAAHAMGMADARAQFEGES